MLSQFQKHTGYYFSLIVILFLTTLLVIISRFDRQMQAAWGILGAVLYVGWGILHHYLYHDLSAKIVVEYVLIGSLGITLMFFLFRVS